MIEKGEELCCGESAELKGRVERVVCMWRWRVEYEVCTCMILKRKWPQFRSLLALGAWMAAFGL